MTVTPTTIRVLCVLRQLPLTKLFLFPYFYILRLFIYIHFRDDVMVSVYQYISVQDLEDYTVKDYSTVDSKYINSVIETWITQAERLVNSTTHQSYVAPIPDHIVSATLLIAQKVANNRLIDDNHLTDMVKVPLLDADINILLGVAVQNNFTAHGST